MRFAPTTLVSACLLLGLLAVAAHALPAGPTWRDKFSRLGASKKSVKTSAATEPEQRSTATGDTSATSMLMSIVATSDRGERAAKEPVDDSEVDVRVRAELYDINDSVSVTWVDKSGTGLRVGVTMDPTLNRPFLFCNLQQAPSNTVASMLRWLQGWWFPPSTKTKDGSPLQYLALPRDNTLATAGLMFPFGTLEPSTPIDLSVADKRVRTVQYRSADNGPLTRLCVGKAGQLQTVTMQLHTANMHPQRGHTNWAEFSFAQESAASSRVDVHHRPKRVGEEAQLVRLGNQTTVAFMHAVPSAAL
ncbi:hypothetical protein RI367_002520 [Sorochytrium milnesiophthora]